MGSLYLLQTGAQLTVNVDFSQAMTCKTCSSGSLMGVPNCTLCQVDLLHRKACIAGPFCQYQVCILLQESA